MTEKVKSNSRKGWSQINIRKERLDALKVVSKQIRFSMAECVDEAVELWLRDMAPKRMELVSRQ